MSETLLDRLEAHLLKSDLASETERWYRCIVGVFCRWYGADAQVSEIAAETLSRFLLEKQRAGRSSHYCKSLRSGLLVILGRRIVRSRVRKIRPPRLQPLCWSKSEVAKLLLALLTLPQYKRRFYRDVILAAWYTGLSQIDLFRLRAEDFSPDGTALIERHKTRVLVDVWLPPEMLARLPRQGLLFARRWSYEQFRRDFRKLVTAAGLSGTFKTLRSTSGTQADILTGRGHEHLGNTRKIFEEHYRDRRQMGSRAVRLPRPKL